MRDASFYSAHDIDLRLDASVAQIDTHSHQIGLADGATIRDGALVGAGAMIDPTARIEGFASVGAGSRIGPGAVIDSSIVWRGVQIGSNAHLLNTILADDLSRCQGKKSKPGIVS